MDLPKRKNIRLKEYDYSKNGAYFITICTHNRQYLFGEIVGAIHESPDNTPKIELNQNGVILQSIIENLHIRYLNIQIDKYIIMPNHVHLIVALNDDRAIRESPLQGRSLISKMVGYLKMNSSKQIRLLNQNVNDVWQRSYHDHIIRNEQEYQTIWEYIDTNPLKWELDRYYIT
jgi:putative transposase